MTFYFAYVRFSTLAIKITGWCDVCKGCSLQCAVIYGAGGYKPANQGHGSLFKQLNAEAEIENNYFYWIVCC